MPFTHHLKNLFWTRVLSAQHRPGLFIHAVVEAEHRFPAPVAFRPAPAAWVIRDAEDGSVYRPDATQIMKADGALVKRRIVGNDGAPSLVAM